MEASLKESRERRRSQSQKEATQFLQKASRELVLDQSRKTFLREIYTTLKRKIEITKHNRTHRLLLGRKGVGKSTLLRLAQRLVTDEFQKEIQVIYMDFRIDQHTSLLDFLIERTGDRDADPDPSIWQKMANIVKNLKKQGKVLWLIIDELQEMYRLPFGSHGKSQLRELLI